MALTSADETDLLLPLLGAIRENPRFATFLERVRRRTGARYIALVIRRGDAGRAAVQEFHAGDALSTVSGKTEGSKLFELDRAHYDSLRPGRVYALSELVEHDPLLRIERRRQMSALGLADERIVRVLSEPNLDAWFILARSTPCQASDSALLSSLAPYVAEALRTARDLDQERQNACLNAAGLARSGSGWIAFDAEGRVASYSEATERWWQENMGRTLRKGERLQGLTRFAERSIPQWAAIMTQKSDEAPRPLLLCETPRLEALLMPITGTSGDHAPLPDATRSANDALMLALFSLPQATSVLAQDRLSAIHALPRREAELAIKLSEGQTIAEAARAMGLTVETARNYSKKIYAKLGVRGKAELVRRVLEGTARMT